MRNPTTTLDRFATVAQSLQEALYERAGDRTLDVDERRIERLTEEVKSRRMYVRDAGALEAYWVQYELQQAAFALEEAVKLFDAA